MGIQERLYEDMKEAMKARDKVRLETIRGLRAHLKNVQLDKGEELTEEEVIQALMGAAKKRKEAIEQYKIGGREDLVELETQELNIIQTYLPEQMSEEKIVALVDEVINEVNATSMKDMGKVMSTIMPKVKGKADGKVVQQIVREKLTSS